MCRPRRPDAHWRAAHAAGPVGQQPCAGARQRGRGRGHVCAEPPARAANVPGGERPAPPAAALPRPRPHLPVSILLWPVAIDNANASKVEHMCREKHVMQQV